VIKVLSIYLLLLFLDQIQALSSLVGLQSHSKHHLTVSKTAPIVWQ